MKTKEFAIFSHIIEEADSSPQKWKYMAPYPPVEWTPKCFGEFDGSKQCKLCPFFYYGKGSCIEEAVKRKV
jgi:hypothetical protein